MTASGALGAIVGRFASLGLARTAIAIVILHFSIVGLVGGVAVQMGPHEPFIGDWSELQTPGTDPLSELIGPLERWDGLWYQHIARDGYTTIGSGAFFPLYPISGGLVGRLLLGNAALGLVVVACVGYGIALVLLGQLAILEAGRYNDAEPDAARHLDPMAVAIVAMLTLATFPTGFFLVGPFTEGLFLAFAIGSMLLARQHRFAGAAIAAALATLTRIQGVFLAASLAWEALQASGAVRGDGALTRAAALRPRAWLDLRRERLVPALAGLVAAATPLLALGVWYLVLGGMLGPSAVGTSAQTPWGYQFVAPWTALGSSVQYIVAHWPRPLSLVEGLDLASLVAFALLAVVGRRLPFAHLLYVLPSIALVATRIQWFLPLMSVSRYVVALFPLFLVIAVLLVRRPRLALAWLAVSAIAQLVLVQWFARWGFVA